MRIESSMLGLLLAVGLGCETKEAPGVAGDGEVVVVETGVDAGVGADGDGGADAGTRRWQGTLQMGTARDDTGRGVAVDGRGSIYVTGMTSGGLDGNANLGLDDIFLIKVTSAGVVEWTRQLGTSRSDRGYGVAVGAEGSVLVTGMTGGDLDGNTSGADDDVFLVKFSSAGVREWTRQLGTSDADSAHGIAVDKGGNIFVAGFTWGDLDEIGNKGEDDVFVTKYTSSGVREWMRQVGTEAGDFAGGVAVDSEGSVYVTGWSGGEFSGDASGSAGGMFLVKFSSEGLKVWMRRFGASGNYYTDGVSVAVDSEGSVYVTGRTENGLDGNTNAGAWDIFLVKYSGTGERKWTRQLGTAGAEFGASVAVDARGNIFVTGSSNRGLDGNTRGGGLPGLSDMVLAKFTSAGVKVWTRQLGTAGSDEGFGVAVDIEGNAFVTGFTRGGIDGNTNAGGADVFLVKYSSAGEKQ